MQDDESSPGSLMVTRRHLGGMAIAGAALAGGAAGRAGGARWDDGLRRSRPEAAGIDPQAVLGFLDDVATAGLELHGFMLARNGRVAAEGWWAPYRADRPHMTHSLTKSVTVSGVALALQEGRFGIDDPVISFFPGQLPPRVSDRLRRMRVRDLLTMQTGQASETSGSEWRQITTSWVAEFFKIPLEYDPGTKFVYTSAASYMLSAIVTKVTGQRLRDYMEPRFFQPLGIDRLSWDVGPDGVNPGGNGLTWQLADSLKLGMLYAAGGVWNGKRILSAEWTRDAGRPQVPEGKYGYQWWIGPDDSYYALGLFTQLSIVFPRHNAVLAINAAIDGSRKLLPLIWKHFPGGFVTPPAPRHDQATRALVRRTASLELLPPQRLTRSPVARAMSGRTFNAAPNAEGITSFRFDFAPDRCLFTLRDARGEHRIEVGLRSRIEGSTSMTGNTLHHQYQPDSMRVVAGGTWTDPDTFVMEWQFVETVFRDTVTCRFGTRDMTFDRSVNVNSAETALPTVRGTLAG